MTPNFRPLLTGLLVGWMVGELIVRLVGLSVMITQSFTCMLLWEHLLNFVSSSKMYKQILVSEINLNDSHGHLSCYRCILGEK